MKKPELIAGLELGPHFFSVAAGQLDERQQLLVRAAESVPAQGIERGVLSDPLECVDAVARLMRQAERPLSARISKVLAAFQGSHLKSYNANASIPIPDPEVGVSPRDVEKAISTCRTLSLDYDRQILHAFERGYTVDGQPGIHDPVGLSGTKLTVELHLVTGLNLAVQNVTRILNRAGLEVEELVLPGLATAEAVLSDLDRDLGITLIRIGEILTEVLLYSEGQIRETFLIPWGTDSLSESLSRALKLPRAAGDQILDQIRTLEEGPDQAQTLLRIKAGTLARAFPQGEVIRLVAGRTKEFLTRLRHRLDETPYSRESASGIVMVGSLARMEGFLELAEQLLNMPVRLGTVREIHLDPQVTLASSHTAAVGLLRLGFKRRLSSAVRPTSMPGWLGWVDRTRRLLEEYF